MSDFILADQKIRIAWFCFKARQANDKHLIAFFLSPEFKWISLDREGGPFLGLLWSLAELNTFYSLQNQNFICCECR
jgi:hypothetical protein